MRIGQRVFDLLEKQSKKQVELANHLGLTTSTVNGWRQENRNPSSDLIIPICKFFNIAPEFLLTGEERQSGSVHVSGSVSGGAVVQGVNHGRVIIRNGHERVLSDEAAELLRVYEILDVKRRIELLNKAFILENEMNKLEEQ